MIPPESRNGLNPEVNSRRAELEPILTQKFTELRLGRAGSPRIRREGVVSAREVVDSWRNRTPEAVARRLTDIEALTELFEVYDLPVRFGVELTALWVSCYGDSSFTRPV